MVNMITEQILIDAGYSKYRKPYSNDHSDFFYHKRFKDDLGTRYFVELVHYPPLVYEGKTVLPAESWMAQVNNNEPHYTFLMHRVNDLETVESTCLCFWKSMHCQHYDLYEPDESF